MGHLLQDGMGDTGQTLDVGDLEDLMAEHLAADFPPSIEKGLDYGTVDPVMIGADIYGWATRANAGQLTETDRPRLKVARDELERSLDSFPPPARPYYAQLVRLAGAALST
jgi:hypothetical protein